MKNLYIAMAFGALLLGAAASPDPVRSLAFEVPPPAAPLTGDFAAPEVNREREAPVIPIDVACENACALAAYTRS